VRKISNSLPNIHNGIILFRGDGGRQELIFQLFLSLLPFYHSSVERLEGEAKTFLFFFRGCKGDGNIEIALKCIFSKETE
jgi:hypothetical protein